MNEKIILFQDTQKIWEQLKGSLLMFREKIQQTESLLDEYYGGNDRLVIQESKNIIQKILERRQLSLKEVVVYLENVEYLFQEKGDLPDEEVVNVAFYTCLVGLSDGKFLNVARDISKILMDSLIEADIPVDQLGRYVELLNSEMIFKQIREYHAKKTIVHLLSNFYDYRSDLFLEDTYAVAEGLRKDIEIQYESDNYFEHSWDGVIHGGYGDIYQTLLDKLTFFNNLSHGKLYSDADFSILNRVCQFTSLSFDKQFLFYREIRSIASGCDKEYFKIRNSLDCISRFSDMMIVSDKEWVRSLKRGGVLDENR